MKKAGKRDGGRAAARRVGTGVEPAMRELLVRLDHLRSSVREVVRAYLANLEHDIIEIRATVGSVKDHGGTSKLRREVMDRMSEMLDEAALKPHKGRRSELKKVEKIIRELQRSVAKHLMAEPRRSR